MRALRASLAGCLVWPLSALPTVQAEEGKWGKPVHDETVQVLLLAEVLEYRRTTDGGDGAAWDVFGWVGGDYHRLWVKTEGEAELGARPSARFDAQVLYGRLVSPYWDLQLGVGQEWKAGPGKDRARTSVVLGLQGLAPYWFELEPSLFLSQDGDLSARLTVEYDLLLTQRLILQPRFETELALQEVEEFGVGRGINNVEAGLRVRYELRRKIAPYVGFTWRRDLGATAALTREEGQDVGELAFAAGLRLWF